MAAPEVRLFAEDQLVRTVPFDSERIRIGRRPENDLVVEDLAVSRVHAMLLRQEDGSVVLEDAGSGNGCFVDGQRVEDRIALPAGRPVRLGRHVLVWVDGDESAASPETPASPGQTGMFDFALEEDLAPEDGLTTDGGVSFDECEEEASDAPPLDALEASGLDDSDLMPPILDEIATADPEPQELPPPPVPADPILDPGPPVALDVEDPLVAPDRPALHAGLVLQRHGKLVRVIAWEGERMCMGRGEDCEIFLDATEVSRRHALLVRDGDTYEVRDLESINGTRVNGEPVRRRSLAAGDVVGVDDFELTFLLDHTPIADEVQVAAPEQRVAPAEAEQPLDLTAIRMLPADDDEAASGDAADDLVLLSDDELDELEMPHTAGADELPELPAPVPNALGEGATPNALGEGAAPSALGEGAAEDFAGLDPAEEGTLHVDTNEATGEPVLESDGLAATGEPIAESDALADTGEPIVEDAAPAPVGEAIVPADAVQDVSPLPEADLFDELEEEKEEPTSLLEVDVAELQPDAPSATLVTPQLQAAERSDAVHAAARELVVGMELRVKVDKLPEPLRSALEASDSGELRLPVELLLRSDGTLS